MGRSVLCLPGRETCHHFACRNSGHRGSSQSHPKREAVPDPKPNDDTMSRHGAGSIDQIGEESSFDRETNASKT